MSHDPRRFERSNLAQSTRRPPISRAYDLTETKLSGYLGSDPLNPYPRFGGRFYWHQARNLLEAANVTALYTAMFDEVDEGTAMFKLAGIAMRARSLIHLP